MATPESSAAMAGSAPEGALWTPVGAFTRGLPPLRARVFADERASAFDASTPTGFIALDLAAELQCPYPATTPLMLARYLVIEAGESFSHHLTASGEVYYVLAGEGQSGNRATSIDWRAGDAFCFPGGGVTDHVATSRTVLFLLTNEPELAFGGFAPPEPETSKVRPAVFRRERVDASLKDLRRGTDNPAAGEYVNITVEPQQEMRTILPSVVVGFNSLQAATAQRPHRHNAAALTLAIDADRVHSMIDGVRFDWRPGEVLLTPPNAVHSHHNEGGAMMKSFVAQDGGIYHYCRATGFAYADQS